MKNYQDILDKECRLIVLRTLADQPDYRCNDKVLEQILHKSALNKTRAYVRTQMKYLEDIGAVKLEDVQGFLVATLLTPGKDHVDMKHELEGVAKRTPDEN